MISKKLSELLRLVITILWDKTTLLLMLAVAFDAMSRYCWRESVFIYYIGQDLMVSTLLYTLYLNTRHIPKIVVESLLVLSGFQIIDECLKLGSIDSPLREVAMAGIGVWTIWKIRRVLKKKS